jgi:hypothetical protein
LGFGTVGNQQIWIRDMRTGKDSMLTATPLDKWHPRFSPDNTKVSFSDLSDDIYIVPMLGALQK